MAKFPYSEYTVGFYDHWMSEILRAVWAPPTAKQNKNTMKSERFILADVSDHLVFDVVY